MPRTANYPIYQWHERVEWLENYSKGGYHPVHIGDKFKNNRYRIVHKLGYGSYSTVWVAQDLETHHFVALKILRADAPGDKSEASVLAHLASGSTSHPGRSHVIRLLDQFTVTGPNGSHQCFVTEAAGYSIASAQDNYWQFPINVARSIVPQVLLGLSYIHSCGVVHADLHSNNILLKSSFFAATTIDELYSVIGHPQELLVERLDGQPIGPEAPRFRVQCARAGIMADDVTEAEIVIADFGEALVFETEGKKEMELRTPTLLLPPEFIFGDGLSSAIDVWTAAFAVYETFGSRPLFEGFRASKDRTVVEMISTLGMLPGKYWDKWTAKGKYFHEDGSWDDSKKGPHVMYSMPLSERLRGLDRGDGTVADTDADKDKLSLRELSTLEVLLRRMLTYDPENRITAQAELNETWTKKYGLEAMKQMWIERQPRALQIPTSS